MDDSRDVGGLLRWNVALLTGFMVLVAVGVWSVLLPELEDQPDERAPSEASAAEQSDEASADEPSEPIAP